MFEIEPQQVKEWLDSDLAILIDVREQRELTTFSIPGAIHNPMSSFDFDAIPIKTDKRLVFVCAHGIRSRQIGEFLLQSKMVQVAYNMVGGVTAWKQAGLPSEDKIKQ